MIELYLSKSCPFCRKVLHGAAVMGLKENVDYVVVDASRGTAGRKVVEERGGQSMVPFLVDGDHCMYESDDIIDYLKNKKRE